MERYNEYHQGQRASECPGRDSQPRPVSNCAFSAPLPVSLVKPMRSWRQPNMEELTRSTVIWHGVTDSVIMHTRSLWLLTQHLWDGSEDPVAHPTSSSSLEAHLVSGHSVHLPRQCVACHPVPTSRLDF